MAATLQKMTVQSLAGGYRRSKHIVRGGLNDRHVKIVCPNCALRTSAITDEFKRKLINEKDLMVVRALEALRDGVRATLLKAADEVGDTNRLRIAVRAGLLRLAAGRHGTNLQTIPPAEAVYINYLPLSKAQIIDHLQLLIPKEQHKYNMELARLTTAFLTQQSHRPLTAIKSHYARMDPEIERWYSINEIDEETFKGGLKTREQAFYAELERVLQTAHYFEITDEVYRSLNEEELATVSGYGVNVYAPLTEYRKLRVWAQSKTVSIESLSVGNDIKHYSSSGQKYKRVFMAVQFKEQQEDEDIYLKMYKNVRCDYLPTLLPKARPVMTAMDKAMFSLMATSALGLLVTRGVHYVHYEEPFQGLIIMAGGCAFMAMRTYQRYNNRRAKYSEKLIKSLSNNTLANNRAALSHLNDMSNIEQFKNLFLAYWFTFTLQDKNKSNMVSQELVQKAVQDWIYQIFHLRFEYSLPPHVGTLNSMGLLTVHHIEDNEVHLQVVKPKEALEILQQRTSCPSWFGTELEEK